MIKQYTINKTFVVYARTLTEAVRKFHTLHAEQQVNDVLVAL